MVFEPYCKVVPIKHIIQPLGILTKQYTVMLRASFSVEVQCLMVTKDKKAKKRLKVGKKRKKLRFSACLPVFPTSASTPVSTLRAWHYTCQRICSASWAAGPGRGLCTAASFSCARLCFLKKSDGSCLTARRVHARCPNPGPALPLSGELT